ncbi:MAG: ester cyclase [Anaerolineae bacterium]
MQIAQGQTVIQRILDQALNRGDLAVIDQLVAPEAAPRSGWDTPASRAELKQLVLALRTAFPDLRCTVEDEIQMGSKSAAHWTLCGTHQGMLMGNRPTGRTVRVEGMIHARMAQDRIAEFRILVDRLGMLQQLGLVPSSPVRPSYQEIRIDENDRLKKGRLG